MADDKSTGLYPADQWKPGTRYEAYDWDGYDAEDFPDEVREQIEAKKATQETAVVKQPTTQPKAESKFSKLVKKTPKTSATKTK